MGVLFSISLITILKDEETLAHGADSGSSSPNSIWMTFGLMAVALFFNGTFHQIIQFSLPKDFDLRVLLTSGSLLGTGLMMALVYASGVVGQLLCGRMADRFSERQLYFTLFLITFPLAALASQFTEIPLVLIMMLVVFLSTGALPVEDTLLVRYVPSHRHGLFFSMNLLLGFEFGATEFFLSGWFFDLTGSFL